MYTAKPLDTLEQTNPNYLKVIKRLGGIVILAFLGSWFIGYIQINGATFDIKDAEVTTYWDYDDDVDGEPYEIVPTRSMQIYEAGYVGLRPDFEGMLNDYIKGETILGVNATFNNGYTIKNQGTDYDFCIYPENLTITKTNLKPFHNSYLIRDKNIFEFENKIPYYGYRHLGHNYYQSHSLDLEIQVDVNGIVSKSYLDYKLKEIYIYYVLDAIRQHVHAEKQFLQSVNFEIERNYMFVKDNFEIDRKEFLNLDPKSIASTFHLQSYKSMRHYTDDDDCEGVWIVTSK